MTQLNESNLRINRQPAIRTLTCSDCGEISSLQKIIYGMPDPKTFDLEEYAFGGCCITGDASDPDIQYKYCKWQSLYEELSR